MCDIHLGAVVGIPAPEDPELPWADPNGVAPSRIVLKPYLQKFYFGDDNTVASSRRTRLEVYIRVHV